MHLNVWLQELNEKKTVSTMDIVSSYDNHNQSSWIKNFQKI